MPGRAELDNVGERPAVRLERRLTHSPEKVWHAITDPAELAHWFPAAVSAELRPGAPIRFTFAGQDAVSTGEILEVDHPSVFAFTWNGDVLRWEIQPDGEGCLLRFTHSFGRGEPAIAKVAAGRTAAGWDVCLDALAARLAGREFEQPGGWLPRIEAYAEEFGLGAGEVTETPDGYLVRFRRDLMWKTLDDVWALLAPEPVGAEPPLPATNGYVAAGEVTIAEAPRVLEYRWLHDGEPAGLVRWEFVHGEFDGTRVELTQTVPRALDGVLPTALAAWHTQLELFFAATHGEIRCHWPEDRTAALLTRYAASQLVDESWSFGN
ncbi:SRPBCC family protein [Amycolatopsis sp. H20-H5]|uniref:SRPBCC family protein n=1 Tax=Amycolatopsis sp. H20-H5 TaxID=3046309 RepID=UPI002DBFCCA8|nr:SRPBCC family protein [Amycolatopsis sp. H20-H5]MEC3978110.1 SRPBCC family protein [Amycolatopsis sp. H20-H5]